jgi:hypothetical protein
MRVLLDGHSVPDGRRRVERGLHRTTTASAQWPESCGVRSCSRARSRRCCHRPAAQSGRTCSNARSGSAQLRLSCQLSMIRLTSAVLSWLQRVVERCRERTKRGSRVGSAQTTDRDSVYTTASLASRRARRCQSRRREKTLPSTSCCTPSSSRGRGSRLQQLQLVGDDETRAQPSVTCLALPPDDSFRNEKVCSQAGPASPSESSSMQAVWR